jgi:hypothetical protein
MGPDVIRILDYYLDLREGIRRTAGRTDARENDRCLVNCVALKIYITPSPYFYSSYLLYILLVDTIVEHQA